MESIVNQTYKGELRLYVVDDGSTLQDEHRNGPDSGHLVHSGGPGRPDFAET